MQAAVASSHPAVFLNRMEMLKDVVCMIDNRGIVLYINSAVYLLWGYSPGEVIGKNILEFISKQDLQRSQMALQRLQRGEAVGFFVNHLITKNGKEVEYEWYSTWDERRQINFGIAKEVRPGDALSQARSAYQQKEERQLLLTTAVIDAEERIRSSIGRELHDNVNQVLTAVKWQLSGLVGDAQRDAESVKKAIQHINYSIEEIRNLSRALSMPSIENIGLVGSVKDLKEIFKDQKDISIHVSGELNEESISQQRRIAAFRIIQEHLTNIAKHSAATEVNISMRIKEGALYVLISDNSDGFDLPAQRRGIGISNMIGRAEALKGTLTIDTAPGKGCMVRLQLPLNEH